MCRSVTSWVAGGIRAMVFIKNNRWMCLGFLGVFWVSVAAATNLLIASGLLSLLLVLSIGAGKAATSMKLEAELKTVKSSYPINHPTSSGHPFTSFQDSCMTGRIHELGKRQTTQRLGEIVLGSIDKDGRYCEKECSLPYMEVVDQDDLTPRSRYAIDLVLKDGNILIKKDFQKDKIGFLHEWHRLTLLQGCAKVPRIHSVNEDQCILYKNWIVGHTVRSVLVNQGAKILRAHTDHDPALADLTDQTRIEKVWERGRKYVSHCLSKLFLEAMEEQIKQIHRMGIAGFSLTYGNIVIDALDGMPWFIDFDNAGHDSSQWSPFLIYRKHEDWNKYAKLYGRHAGKDFVI